MSAIKKQKTSQDATCLELEVDEIMDMLPSFSGTENVIEWGAREGRFTSALASKVDTLRVMESDPSLFQENVSRNGEKSNVTLVMEEGRASKPCKDSVDMLMTNWTLMYVDDDDMRNVVDNMLDTIRTGGYLFMRESCFQKSGIENTNTHGPTAHYRHPSFYVDALRRAFQETKEASSPEGEGKSNVTYFELVSSRSISAYRKLKGNHGQVCFLWKKVEQTCTAKEMVSFQKFLDEAQYSVKSILRYEKIFGKGYVSTGGQETTTEFVTKLALKQGDRVLDVGCGIGGGNFYMAEEFGASVVGIDLSTNMIHFALERAVEKSALDVEFEICDATAKVFPECSFDVVYSRDTILHIEDKASLFASFFKWLKPGGQVMISDYCCGETEPSDRFKTYVAGRGYHLLSPIEYGKVLESVGFEEVVVSDRTEQFIKVLNKEVERTLKQEEDFVNETSQEDFDAIIDGWKTKIVRCNDGDQKWGFFMAKKPLV